MSAELLEWVRDYGAAGVFLMVMAENLGIMWVTSPAYIVAAEIVRSGRMEFWTMGVLISAGHFSGATLAWGIMRGGENAISRFFSRNRRLDDAHSWLMRWYEKRGPITLVAGRLIGQIRPWASLAAGLARVGAVPFLLWTAIGTVIYSFAVLWAFYTGVRLWVEAPELRWLIVGLLAAGSASLGVYLLIRHIRERGEERLAGE